MPYLQVKLVKVFRGRSPSIVGGDGLFIVGAFVVGTGDEQVTKSVRTRPVPIFPHPATDATVSFDPGEAALFEHDVAADSSLHLALSAWHEHREERGVDPAQALAQLNKDLEPPIVPMPVVGGTEPTPEPPMSVILVDRITHAFHMNMLLGTLSLDMPVSHIQAEDERTWRISEPGWEYTITYVLSHTP